MEQELEEQEFMLGWCKFCNREHKFVTKVGKPEEVVGCVCPLITTREEIQKYPVVVKELSNKGFWDLQLRREE